MNLWPPLLLAGGAALHLVAWGEPAPACSQEPDQPVRECLIQAPQAGAQGECRSELTLESAYREARLRAGVDYRTVFAAAQALRAKHGLSFRVLFRPTMPDNHGKLLAMNPHERSDVKVCNSHQVELYVGRAPLRPMPQESLVGLTLAEARNKLGATQREPGRVDPLVCWQGATPLDSQRVEAQWPAANSLLGTAVPLSRFEMPEQPPVLFLRHVSRPPEDCRPCDNCMKRSPPESPPSDGGGLGPAAAGAAAGLGAGLALTRLLGGEGSNRSGGPGRPGENTASRLPQTRVRPDLDTDESNQSKELIDGPARA